MPLRFLNRKATPPGGFQFIDPDTGFRIVANNYPNFLRLLDEHREGNGLPLISAPVAEDQCCRNLDGAARNQFCEDSETSGRIHEGVQLNMSDILRGTKTLLRFKVEGSPTVAQAEANRRASICAECPQNVPFNSPCGGLCDELLGLVEGVVSGRRVERGNELKACGVCHCSLPAKVWLPVDIIRRYESSALTAKYPSPHCWLSTQPTPPESGASGVP
jgi:hypothetical protein